MWYSFDYEFVPQKKFEHVFIKISYCVSKIMILKMKKQN